MLSLVSVPVHQGLACLETTGAYFRLTANQNLHAFPGFLCYSILSEMHYFTNKLSEQSKSDQ